MPSDIDEMSDEEVLQHGPIDMGHPDSTPNECVKIIARMTQHTVLKPSFQTEDPYSSEMFALQVVAEQTSIPVSHVRMLISIPNDLGVPCNYFVMEYIPGRSLFTVWPTLSWFGRLPVALIIRPPTAQNTPSALSPRSACSRGKGCPFV